MPGVFKRYKDKPKAKRAKHDRYRVDTYVEDGVYNERYGVTSYHKTIGQARNGAIKQEKSEKRMMDHGLYHIDSAISFNRKKYKTKPKKHR